VIHHISIAAQQPLPVAEALAEILQGQVVPFPFHEGSYLVLTFDPHGTMIEVLPQGSELKPGGAAWMSPNPQVSTYNAFHAAISVPTSEVQIHEIAKRTGWHVQTCNRAGQFNVIEVWIENWQLLEFLPPAFAAQYLAAMQPIALKQFIAELGYGEYLTRAESAVDSLVGVG
jgi:hypothetical protein